VDILKSGKDALLIESEAIKKACENLNGNFVKAIEILSACKGRVVVTGMGKSGLIAKKIAATLASTGTPSLFLHPAEGLHGDLGMITRDDAVIALSNSGETEELISILPVIKRFKIPLISLVGKVGSTLAARSDCVLDASVEKEACPLNLAPTASTTVALALGDAIAVALLEKREFTEADFAVFHPSGSLGKRRALFTVQELLHMKEDLPLVNEKENIKTVLEIVTSKKLGSACVVDDDGMLVGVFTDGDLRRVLNQGVNIFDHTIGELATKNPKTIESSALAARALQVMEEYAITNLISVDENNKPVGMIHLHDILKAGIV